MTGFLVLHFLFTQLRGSNSNLRQTVIQNNSSRLYSRVDSNQASSETNWQPGRRAVHTPRPGEFQEQYMDSRLLRDNSRGRMRPFRQTRVSWKRGASQKSTSGRIPRVAKVLLSNLFSTLLHIKCSSTNYSTLNLRISLLVPPRAERLSNGVVFIA